MDINVYQEFLIRSDNKITIPSSIVEMEGLKKNDWIKISILNGEQKISDIVKIRQTKTGYFSASIPKRVRARLNGSKNIKVEIKKAML